YALYSELDFIVFFFFSSRRRHTRSKRDWSSDVCSSDLPFGKFISSFPFLEWFSVYFRLNFKCMTGNSFGKLFKLTTFGESHGVAIGGIIDGCPPGIDLDLKQIQFELDRRKPGQSKITTQRKEEDQVEFLSGIFEGKTTGTPIGFTIHNKDQKSRDYSH